MTKMFNKIQRKEASMQPYTEFSLFDAAYARRKY